MKLSELLKNVEVEGLEKVSDLEISGIAADSRKVGVGNLFICISGFQTDGHEYAQKAVEMGAYAILAERALTGLAVPCLVVKNSRRAMAEIAANFYGHPEQNFRLIGVTGTNGKTTTTYLVKAVLEAMGKKVGLIGTNQNMIGTEIIPTKHTTPDSPELMKLFSDMAEKNVDVVVMEVSSHSLALDRVTACRFDVGAFTNITQDHLDFHGTMEAYLEAKGILFSLTEHAVINADDEGGAKLIQTAGEHCLTYGLADGCKLRASNVELMENGVAFSLSYEGKTYDVELGIPGMFNVYNAMAALSCLVSVGVPMEEAVTHLKVARGVKGRVEIVPTGQNFTVIIDYAHTPDGLYNVIETIRGFAKKRILVVFGCGGDRDKTKRPKMGKIASEMADFCVVTSDNPRTEDPEKIIEDILVGVKEGKGDYAVVPNRFEAIEYALDHAREGDVVLLAGKGHETYQILADRTISFDEREIVHKLLHYTQG